VGHDGAKGGPGWKPTGRKGGGGGGGTKRTGRRTEEAKGRPSKRTRVGELGPGGYFPESVGGKEKRKETGGVNRDQEKDETRF